MAAHVHHHCHVLMNVGAAPSDCVVDGIAHPCTADWVVMIDPWVRHCLRVAPGASPAMTLAFYIEPKWLGGFAGAAALAGARRFFGAASIPLSPDVRRLRNRLIDMMAAPEPPSSEIEGCIYAIVLRLTHENPPPGAARDGPDPFAHAAIGHAVSLIRAARGHVPDFARLARDVGMSRPRFFHRFRDIVGAPPGLFANYIRFETALAELSEPDIPLLDISLDLGFAEQSSFTRFFGKHFGASPLAYRRSLSALDSDK